MHVVDSSKKPTIVIITTVGITLETFLRRQVAVAQAHGYEVVAISSPSEALDEFARVSGVRAFRVPMKRQVSLLGDLRATWTLYWLLRQIRPEILHTHTPKAGLLGMIAGWFARVPVRIYTVNGLVAASRRGTLRNVLMGCERLACVLASRVFCVSPSLRRTLVRLGTVDAEKAFVIGSGSSHGVNLAKFDPQLFSPEMRRSIRRELGLPENGGVVGFVGRFVRDKGIFELIEAWKQVHADVPSAHLLLCGYMDTDVEAWECVNAALHADPSIQRVSARADDMPRVCAALDVGVLPTWREGLPNVLLEFAAMGVGIVATRVPGCMDVVDRMTAIMVPPRNVDALVSALVDLLTHPSKRASLGEEARRFVCRDFSEDRICSKVVEAYDTWRK